MSEGLTSMKGESRVVREEFLPAGTAYYRDLISEEDCLIPKQLSSGFGYSAVSVSRLSNVKVWIDNQVICVYDDEYGIYEELCVHNEPIDFERVIQTPLEHMGNQVVLFPHLYPQNYYHWLIDTLPCFGVLEMAGMSCNTIDRYHIHRFSSKFQIRHLEQLGVDPNKVNSWNNGVQHFSVNELIVPFFRLDKGWPNPWAVDYLKRQWLPGPGCPPYPHAANDEVKTGKRIYVARGNSRRRIINEAELINRLSREGYLIVEPHKLTIEEQASYFFKADQILGSHGAGLVNLAFSRPGVKVMEFAGHYITLHFRLVSRLSQLQYRSIAAGLDESGGRLSTSDNNEARGRDFVADIDHIVAEADSFFSN